MDARAEFESLYHHWQAKQKEFRDGIKEREAAYCEALLAEWKRLYPRRKKLPEFRQYALYKALPEDIAKAIFEQHQKAGNAWWDRADQEIKGADMALDCIKDVPFSGAKEYSVYQTVSETDYSTQGLGSHKYAKESAEGYADEARRAGLDAKVEEKRTATTGAWRSGWSDFTVLVQGNEIDMEVLRRRPGLSLREWIKSCWKRGVNPRVYNPFLPAGLEESYGLDYFGGETRKEASRV